MKLSSTIRLYLEDDHCFEAEANVLSIRENKIAFDRTCFYPGGGGQPPDNGFIEFPNGRKLQIESATLDESGVIWHICNSVPGEANFTQTAKLILNKPRRIILSRYHTVLHVLNTIVLRDYDGWITGVQIGEDYSRIDFKLENFSRSMSAELERKVNSVLVENHLLKAYYIPEEEFCRRNDLIRTLEAKPPVVDGRIRIVEIEGFDAQACGGTHVRSTSEAGRFSIFRMDNKGRQNKRFYVRLD